MRSFSTAGPVRPAKHYCIPPLSRIDLDAVLGMVRDEKYFVLHAPRQTGKTTALLALADLLNERGYHCLHVTVETARTARDDVAQAVRVVLAALAEAAAAALGDRGWSTRSPTAPASTTRCCVTTAHSLSLPPPSPRCART